MKYVKMICLTAVALITLASCDNGSSAPARKNVEGVAPNITRYGTFSILDESYVYLVDNNTGVVYLEYDCSQRHAISVMLNADGTPVTAEQLGLK